MPCPYVAGHCCRDMALPCPPTLLARIRDFFAHGTAQVWVLYPDQRELHQHIRGAANVKIYSANDVLDADEILPGLALRVRDLFVLPTDAPA